MLIRNIFCNIFLSVAAICICEVNPVSSMYAQAAHLRLLCLISVKNYHPVYSD